MKRLIRAWRWDLHDWWHERAPRHRLRWVCRIFGHRYEQDDCTTPQDFEPMVRIRCRLCDYDGGWL